VSCDLLPETFHGKEGGDVLPAPGSAIRSRRSRGDLVSFTSTATTHPALIPHEAPGSSRRCPPIPATQWPKGLLTAEIPAYPRSTRKRHDRPVTPEVAGSSPVAPAKVLQIGTFCCRLGPKRPPASFHPALIPRRK
jgi:hypothetical protein